MKTFDTVVGIGFVAVVGLGLAVWVGPDKIRAWNSVVKDDVIIEIEARLGQASVQRAEIHSRVAGLAASVERLREAQVSTAVQGELAEARAKTAASIEKRAESALARLRGLIAADTPTTLGGRAFSQSDLNTLGLRVMATLEGIRAKRSSLEDSHRFLAQTATQLGDRVDEAANSLSQMNDQLAVLDAKVAGLSVLRQVASVTGSADGLTGQFQSLKDDIDGLMGRVQAEERLWSGAVSSTRQLEPLLAELGYDSTLERIDELLGRMDTATPSGGAKGDHP